MIEQTNNTPKWAETIKEEFKALRLLDGQEAEGILRDDGRFVSDWWLSKMLEREKELELTMKNVYQNAKEDHICRFNDGEQNCDCYLNGMSKLISLLAIDEKKP